MDTKKLRQKILDLAIRGKLVPQDPNDEPASVLLERIRAEKEKLIKEGKIKRSKVAKASDTPHYEQVPFEVPDSWVWTTLGEIGTWQAGGTPSRSNKAYYGGSIPWLKTGDLNDGLITNIPESITEAAVSNSSAKINPAGSILIAMYGATIGKLGILSFPAATNQACCACVDNNICQLYLFYFLLSQRIAFIEKGGGGAQPNISKEIIIATAIPIPPLAEQQRIVSEIEHWFTLIDQIEQGKADLQTIIKQTKSKILDLAIHGKLVPQDPNDEPASELLKRINPQAKITCDNGHDRKLPQGWSRCHLKDVLSITMGQSPNGETINHTNGIEFHQGKLCFSEIFVRNSNIYTSTPTKIAEKDSLLLCVRAPVGIVNIVERRVCIGRGLCSLRPKEGNIRFYFYWLQTLQDTFEQKATGSTFKAISGDIIKDEYIMLPPLAEQQRIVQRIEEIFSMLNSIQQSLEA